MTRSNCIRSGIIGFYSIAVWLLAFYFGWHGNALGADLDSIREPIVRPNAEALKKWLYGQELVLEKRTLWFNRTEKLDPGKWAKLSAQGGSVVSKAVGTNIATSIWSFEYPDGKGGTNKYVAAVEYEWTLKLGSIDRVFLKAIITGP